MRFSGDAKTMVTNVALMSSEKEDSVRNFFEGLVTQIIFDYMEGKPTTIPFVGSMSISYEGDEEYRGGRRAILSVKIDPDEFLTRNIGQFTDGEESDIEEIYKKKIRANLTKNLQ